MELVTGSMLAALEEQSHRVQTEEAISLLSLQHSLSGFIYSPVSQYELLTGELSTVYPQPELMGRKDSRQTEHWKAGFMI